MNKMGAEHPVVKRLSASEGVNNARAALAEGRREEAQVCMIQMTLYSRPHPFVTNRNNTVKRILVK